MRRIVSNIKVQSFMYDFSLDGGAIGIFRTGITIPVTGSFNSINFKGLVAMTSAGGVWNLGWAAAPTALLMGAALVPVGDFVSIFNNNPSIGAELVFSISVAPFTGGKTIFNVVYIDANTLRS